MKRIVVDARCIFDSGIGVYIREVLIRLSALNCFEIKVILLNHQLDDFYKLDIPVHQVFPIDFGRYSLKNLFCLNHILKDCSFYFMPALSVTPIFSKVKKLVVVHDLCPIALRQFFGLPTAFFYWCILGGQILFSKKIVCISEFTKKQLLFYFSGFFKSRITVIYNGLSERFSADNSVSEKNNDLIKPYFLCVGNIKPHKNIINLVNFFVSSSQFGKSHRLVVVGKSDGFRTGIELPANSNESVVFTGFVSDLELTELYKNADAYLFPSLYEGFGLPILEAMSFQLPILASNIPVFKEIADEYVTYFNPFDFNDFDSKLSELLKNKVNDYSGVLSFFTWDRCVEQIADILKNEDFTSK
ncbi:glycosyltransferase family 4 protein [Shewanella sp.]|uniref:glycosyltransferase family 4 protein n=1 Tax=Shewanella sp. TaxID=50422 RepID=UPI0040477AD1